MIKQLGFSFFRLAQHDMNNLQQGYQLPGNCNFKMTF